MGAQESPPRPPFGLTGVGDPGGVLIADETGFIKKGTRSAGWRVLVLAPGAPGHAPHPRARRPKTTRAQLPLPY
jgi:hypothetical protein